MRNFILPEGFKDESELMISGEQFHYLRRVLRLREGDELSGTNGKGRSYTLSVGEIRRHSLTLLVTGYQERSVDNCRISLLQCLPKGKKMDLIVRQAAEAGVWRIIKEALQQSGSLCPTGVVQPVNMEAFVEDKERDSRVEDIFSPGTHIAVFFARTAGPL